MTEKEKMLAGLPYDCGDAELVALWHKGKRLMRLYNETSFDDRETLSDVLGQLLGARGRDTWIAAPFFVDYGENIFLGENCEINMNCVFLDCNTITIGDNALIAPGVHIYTVFHPVKASERLGDGKKEGFTFCKCLTAPVKIGRNVWIGGGSIILPGVTIGDNVTIGAGSVVTKDIPSDSLAYGNPCRVVREIG